MSYATIDELRSQLGGAPVQRSPEYLAKMMHPVPPAEVVDRPRFILERVTGKTVLDIGASGDMHAAIVAAAKQCYGWDREDSVDVFGIDLDNPDLHLPKHPGVEVVVCGEVIEHLSNPGFFLKRLKVVYAGLPVIITVPNAFSEPGRQHMKHGHENVNKDHVAWYSYRTMQTLLERVGYRITDFRWYNGKPFFAEGLIFVAE